MWTFSTSELGRICRDLAWSEMQTWPALRPALPPRTSFNTFDLRSPELALDSLQRVSLATAAATWFNAIDSGHGDLFLARPTWADWVATAERARREGASDCTFTTSGTQGERKSVRHAQATLHDEASGWAHRLPARRRVLCLVPVHHLYGFIWGLLLPRVLGVPVVDALLEDGITPETGDLIVGVPAQWQVLTQLRPRAWPAGVIAVSSTAPLPAELHQRLLDSGLAGVWDIYGASETGGVGLRSLPGGPHELAPHRWKMSDGAIAHRGPDGKPWQIDCPDDLQWEPDQPNQPARFRLGARRDGVVQVGGHNVDPAWVAQQIRQMSGVRDCAVRLAGSGADARLKAFVVLAPHAKLDALQAAWRELLPWYAVPQRVTVGDAVPTNAMGKRVDWS
jgi:long-chain acyl-CoA synthetase